MGAFAKIVHSERIKTRVRALCVEIVPLDLTQILRKTSIVLRVHPVNNAGVNGDSSVPVPIVRTVPWDILRQVV